MMRYGDLLGGGMGMAYQAAPPLGQPRMPPPVPMMRPGTGFGGMLQNPQPMFGGGSNAPKGSASGWLDAIKGAIGDLEPRDKVYLGASAIGGIADWWQGRADRKEDKRRYEEEVARDRERRETMSRNWNQAFGR